MPRGVYVRTAEHKRKIAESHRGMKHTEETKRKIGEGQFNLPPDELKKYKDKQSSTQAL